jgi:hypothetical protein
MFRRSRIALAGIVAAGALVLSGATPTHAAVPHTARAAAPVPPGFRLSSLRSAVPDLPYRVELFPDIPKSFCLNSVGYGQQTDLGSCVGLSQEWHIDLLSPIDSRGGAWAEIINMNDGYCLDAQNNATGSPNTNGDHVNSWPCDALAQQRWYFWPIANGDWMIVNGFNTNKVLDARTSGPWKPTVPGDPVQVWDHVGTPQQAWVIWDVGN